MYKELHISSAKVVAKGPNAYWILPLRKVKGMCKKEENCQYFSPG